MKRCGYVFCAILASGTLSSMKRSPSGEFDIAREIALLCDQKPCYCQVCQKGFIDTDRSYLCPHQDHPQCLYEQIKKTGVLSNHDLISLLSIPASKIIFLNCIRCLKKYGLGPITRKKIYEDCIALLEELSPSECLDKIGEMPGYLAQKILDQISQTERIKYFTQLTDTQKQIFLTKLSPKNWKNYLAQIDPKETVLLLSSSPVLNFIRLEAKDRISSFKKLNNNTKQMILIAFWPDLTTEEQMEYLQCFIDIDSNQEKSWLFLSLMHNHDLSEESIIYLFDVLLLQQIDKIPPGMLAHFFSKRLTIKLFYSCAEKVITALKTTPERLIFLENIWPLLQQENQKELFDLVCAKLNPSVPPTILAPFITSFSPEIAYAYVKNILNIYPTAPAQAQLIERTAHRLTKDNRKKIFMHLLTASIEKAETKTLVTLSQGMRSAELTECALAILKETGSINRTAQFINETGSQYVLSDLLKLFDSMSKKPLDSLEISLIFKICVAILRDGYTDHLFTILKKLENSPEKQFKLLTFESKFKSIYNYPFLIKQRIALLQAFLDNPMATSLQKRVVINRFAGAHTCFYPEQHKNFYDFSKAFKEPIIELLSDQSSDIDIDFIKIVLAVADTQTKDEYFAYMSDKNRTALLSLFTTTNNQKIRFLSIQKDLESWFATRSAQEKLTRIMALPETVFTSFYPTIQDTDKKILFENLKPEKRLELLYRLPSRKEWAFYGKQFPALLESNSLLTLFFYENSKDSQLFLKKSDISLDCINTLQPHWSWLSTKEKEIIFCKLCKIDPFKIFFPNITSKKMFKLLSEDNKPVDQGIIEKKKTSPLPQHLKIDFKTPPYGEVKNEIKELSEN